MNRLVRCLIFCAVLCGATRSALAASPWFVDHANSGKPYTWPAGQLVWYNDNTSLGTFSASQVFTLIQQAFDVWSGAKLARTATDLIPVSNLRPTYGGAVDLSALKTAVRADCCQQFVQPGTDLSTLTPSMKTLLETNCKNFPPFDAAAQQQITQALQRTLIIMDDDGFLVACSGGDPDSVAAMTLPVGVLDEKNIHLLIGQTIVNGRFLKNATLQKSDPALRQFMAVLIHELGHLFNLDHSALNSEACTIDPKTGEPRCEPNVRRVLPTMFPFVSPDQDTLKEDDVVAISNLYPRPEFQSQFCEIAGKIIGSDGLGFQGAEVTARANVDALDKYSVAISAVSGNYFAQDTADGSYVLRGIKPGVTYFVSVGSIPAYFVGASSIQPYGDDDGEKPRLVDDALITAGGGKFQTVSCDAGGKTILMDTVQIKAAGGGTPPPITVVPGVQPVVPAVNPDPSANNADPNASGHKGCTLVIGHRGS